MAHKADKCRIAEMAVGIQVIPSNFYRLQIHSGSLKVKPQKYAEFKIAFPVGL
jgi:hypothetical protein